MSLTEYINQSKRINKSDFMKSCKIALLSNFTINGLGEVMKVLCSENKIYADIYVPNYNQYMQEILNKSSQLYNFNPDAIFLLIDISHFLGDFYHFPYRLTAEERKKVIEQKFQELKNLITLLKQNISSKIILNNFLLPLYSSRGILENKQDYGIRTAINHLNNMLEDFAKNDSQLFIFDINSFAAKEGHNSIIDNKINYLADMKLSPPAIISLAEEYQSYILPLMSMTKKCIILDLDNTLWGGVVGEDGISNLKLGPEKEGKPFYDFQKRLLELSERGIILAINSKNNRDDAIEVLKNHPYMLLREDNFAAIKINWEDKVRNIKEIATELELGIDSFVFIDDDKTNREFVRQMLPEVFVVELPRDPCDYVKTLESLKIFNSFAITKEDLEKKDMYLSQKKRNELKENISDLTSFLRELNLELTLVDVDEFNLPRASQLTQKTNQFNLTTKRYTEENLKNFLNTGNYLLKIIQVRDRFGDYGITGLAIIKKLDSETWEIDTFLLSCRILGKEIEFAFLQELVNKARKENIKKINAVFIQTLKNMPAANFLRDAGFDLKNQSEKEANYSLDTSKENKKSFYIDIKC
jgi:FkbH-like protein